MKLLQLRVRNYRVHRDVVVDFADDVTVIAAPNEAGKSTLVEALHRALFWSHRGGGQVRERMLSRHGGQPEVELHFATDGAEWRLRKVFGGGNAATCELVDVTNARQWTSNDAEQQLARLTGHAPLSGRQGDVDAAWDHLWIWQGRGQEDPLASAHGRAALQKALTARADVAEGMALAAGDDGLLQQVRSAVAATWMKTGRDVRAESEAGQLRVAAEAAAAACAAAVKQRDDRAGQAAALQQKRGQQQTAAAAFAAVADEAEALKTQIKALRPKVVDEDTLAERCQQAQDAAKAHQDLLDEHANAVAAHGKAQRVHGESVTALAQKDQSLAEAKTSCDRWLDEIADAEEAEERLRHAAARRRLRAEVDECTQRLGRLQAQAEKRATAAAAVVAAKQAVQATLPITDKQVKELDDLAGKLATAEARLDAAAVKLVRTAGEAEVRVDGAPLARDSAVQVTRAAEIVHADGTRLQLYPGAGDAAALATTVQQLREQSAAALRRLGVDSREEARRRCDERSQRAAELQQAEIALTAMADPNDDIQQASAAAAKAEQELAALPDDDEADGMADVAELLRAAEARRTGAKAAEKTARGAFNAAVSARNEAALAESRARGEATRFGDRINELTTKLGDEAARAARSAALAAAVQQLADARAANAPLAKELKTLTQRQETVDNQLRRTGDAASSLGGEIKVLEEQLGGERTEDLDARVDAAVAERDRTARAAAAARMRAEADRLLLTTMESVQQEQQARREQPFLAACARYLTLAHGPGARIGLVGENDGERRLGLVDRAGVGLGAFDFQELSRGGQELTALAARLAMAEVIAAERADRGVPLVLDDSLTNLDPQRTRDVGWLLVEAARQGVQIVLATCDTERAQLLRPTRLVALPPPAFGAAPPPTAAPTPSDEGDGDAADAATAPRPDAAPDDGDELLAALRRLGGTASVRVLRQELGWDVTRFDRVRQGLLAGGLVVTPPGQRSLQLVG